MHNHAVLVSHSGYFLVASLMAIIFGDEVGLYFSMNDLILSNTGSI